MTDPQPLTRAALEHFPLPRIQGGDKDSHGQILIIAGSREVPGAALLCATAAMRAGAGKLQIATVESIAPMLGVAMPEAMVVGLPEQRDGGFARSAVARIAELAADADAIVAGPGVATGPVCERIAEALLESPAALTLDAALLHALTPLDSRTAEHPLLPVLLPHAGELAALLDCDEKEVESEPLECGLKAAELYRAIVLVKGVSSHIVHPGDRAWTFSGGVPGLGVSGSGDTLAGIVGGLLARGAEPLTALLWAVLLHGEAGAALSKRIGPTGFLAREIAHEIPALLAR